MSNFSSQNTQSYQNPIIFPPKNIISDPFTISLQYIPTVPSTFNIEVKAIAKTQSPKKVHIVGCADDKYKELEAAKDMVAELLDLQDPNNEVAQMNDFVPFTMKVTTEGIKITMMEIPSNNTAQPNNGNVTKNPTTPPKNGATGNKNPTPQEQQNTDGHLTDEYDDQSH